MPERLICGFVLTMNQSENTLTTARLCLNHLLLLVVSLLVFSGRDRMTFKYEDDFDNAYRLIDTREIETTVDESGE